MKTSCGKFLNLAHYFPYDVKLRLLAHSRSFLANQKAINAIVGAENLLNANSDCYPLYTIQASLCFNAGHLCKTLASGGRGKHFLPCFPSTNVI